MTVKKGRVLCVDDEPNILRTLRWLLQKEFDVDVAASGPEGLGMIGRGDYDVVISDQRMPGMTGSEFLREVRVAAPRAMRILLTGYSDMPAILRSVNEGEVFRFVNKPWKPDELLPVVREAAGIARAHAEVRPLQHTGESVVADLAGEALLVVDDDPTVTALINEAVASAVPIIHARDVAEAVAAFDEQPIGIVVSNMRVGDLDATRMLKLLKQQHPDIVAIVYTEVTDAVDVIALINQAQIFRFLPKPVRATMLKLALGAAAAKRKQLRDEPAYRLRHAVQAQAEAAIESLVQDIKHVARATPARAIEMGTFLQRLGVGLRRMLGRA